LLKTIIVLTQWIIRNPYSVKPDMKGVSSNDVNKVPENGEIEKIKEKMLQIVDRAIAKLEKEGETEKSSAT